MPEFSPNQQHYLKTLRRRKQSVILIRILLFTAFFILWETAATLDWIDSFIFSSPSRVASAFGKMAADGSLFLHIGITLAETLFSFVLVIVLGLFAAVLLWLFPALSQILDPYLVVLNSLPKSALAPLLIVWLGANMSTIVVAGVSVAIFGAILNIYTGFTDVSPEKIKLIYKYEENNNYYYEDENENLYCENDHPTKSNVQVKHHIFQQNSDAEKKKKLHDSYGNTKAQEI